MALRLTKRSNPHSAGCRRGTLVHARSPTTGFAPAHQTIPNQKGKPTAIPTLRWVFQPTFRRLPPPIAAINLNYSIHGALKQINAM
jgi:hypothetical protein